MEAPCITTLYNTQMDCSIVFETFISCIVLPAGRRRGWEVQGEANIKSFLKKIAVDFFFFLVDGSYQREKEKPALVLFLKPS